MKKAILVYPHQLFLNNDLISNEHLIFVIEDPLFFTQYFFHKQKIILHRASMKAYCDMLTSRNHTVIYIEAREMKNSESIGSILKKHGITEVDVFDVVDDWLLRAITAGLSAQKITFTLHETPLFLTSQKDLDTYFLPKIAKSASLLTHSFYVWQRKRLNILVDIAGKPIGGIWSYDKENRKRLPKNETLHSLPEPSLSQYVIEAREYVQIYFKKNYGSTEHFMYPVTHEEARLWFADFLEKSLEKFGPYEDAITEKHPFVYHSVLSPLLNNGLLDVRYVVEETLRVYIQKGIPLASVEGFMRQIIGWREYVRAMYVYHGRTMRRKNYFKATKKLSPVFWNGTTGLLPVDHTIKTAQVYAYSHHISRLMIMGNIMNLCGIDPDDVYRWFMEMYIDAYDWVMVPNVYGMALYADGGTITTKPYVSSSRYILSMSDYAKGEWTDIWDALFWNFVHTHFAVLSKENRLGFIGTVYTKMSKEKIRTHIQTAHKYITSL